MRKSIKIILGAIIVFAIVVLAVAEGFLQYALKPGRSVETPAELSSFTKEVGALRDTFIISRASGDSLHAYYLRADSATNKVAIIVHGYGQNALSMNSTSELYYRQLHYNILLPDLHYHGMSEGGYAQMGCLDRLDVLQWCGVADTLFGGATKQVLDGVSMGAATIMSVSGEELPSYICCFVEDCGYTSVWDEFSNQMRDRFSLPSFPLLNITSALCKCQLGWSFDEITPLQQVAKCHKPMLFIHGSKDTYVETSMVYRLYKAKPQPKELWIAPDSKHADALIHCSKEYAIKVKAFVERYM